MSRITAFSGIVQSSLAPVESATDKPQKQPETLQDGLDTWPQHGAHGGGRGRLQPGLLPGKARPTNAVRQLAHPSAPPPAAPTFNPREPARHKRVTRVPERDPRKKRDSEQE